MDIFRHSTSPFIASSNNAENSQGILIAGLHETTEIVPAEFGVFLQFTWEKPSARQVIDLGVWHQVERFTACHRYEPFWMKPCAGTQVSAVPIETQSLISELADKTCLLVIPMMDGGLRASLQGTEDNRLELVVESGDVAVVGNSGVFLYLALDADPYALMENGAGDVKKRLGIRTTRWTDTHREFTRELGWCTWDAFYQDVSHDKVREGLQSFKDGGITPKYLILDDGWQSIKTMPTGERRLTAFAANEKFPGDLAPTVKMAKEEFGVKHFLVWHALHGYWGGVDGESLPGYDVQSLERKFSEGILHHVPTIENWWGRVQGVVSPKESYRFFQDYHRHLRAQGVDGVKVDNQAALEGTAHGFGVGRVKMMQQYHEALEGSVSVQFGGNLINCMSCASEMFYSMSRNDLVRTSTDFWPNRPESHGLHLYTNAQVSVWFGQFCQPDWDMFQSGHAAGTYHAVGRVAGGSPIYVSDKPGQQNFDLLRKLVNDEGEALIPYDYGVPSRDCLFHDPTQEDILLKICNRDVFGETLVGVFNARYNPDAPDTPVIRGSISPAGVVRDGGGAKRFVVFAHFANELRVMQGEDVWEIELPPLGCELFTLVPIYEGKGTPCEVLGDTEKFCSLRTGEGGSIEDETGVRHIVSRCTPRCTVWCAKRPKSITVEEQEHSSWTYDETTGRLDMTDLPKLDSEIAIQF